MNGTDRKKWSAHPAYRVAQLVWLGALLVFVVGAIVHLRDRLPQALTLFSAGWIIPVVFMEIAKRSVGSFRWSFIMNGASWSQIGTRYWLHARNFFISNLFGYIPIGVAPMLTRIELYRREGYSRLETAGFHLVESLVLAISSLPLAVLAALLITDMPTSTVIGLFGIATLLCLALLHPAGLQFVLKRIGRSYETTPDFLTSLSLFGFGLAAKAFGGFAFVLILLGFGLELSPVQILGAIGLLSGAWLIGMLAIWAPAGLGVREGVLAAGLLGLTSVEVAIWASVIARFGALLADGLLGGSSLGFHYRIGTRNS